MRTLTACCLASLFVTSAHAAQQWTIPFGTQVVYDTDVSGPLVLERLVIDNQAELEVVGTQPFELLAIHVIVRGTLTLSGEDSPGIVQNDTTNIPAWGGLGNASGGRGGNGSNETTMSTAQGGTGFDSFGMHTGGVGGESTYSADPIQLTRKAAGGGGGALAANQIMNPDPYHPSNRGLWALPGIDGWGTSPGALTDMAPSMGGSPGAPFFQDADPVNDFWGVRLLPDGSTLVGEALFPVGGRGGGGGGDAVRFASFPLIPFSDGGDEKGAGGGGGGGMGLLHVRRFKLGPFGRMRANGGRGAHGEFPFGLDPLGGGSGGGSGGWLVIESQQFDLSDASPNSIEARGGLGGPGFNLVPSPAIGAGGQGGPGVIQLHTLDGTHSSILLPDGVSLDDITVPDAHVLLPILGG